MPKSHADKPQQKQDQMAHRLRPHCHPVWTTEGRSARVWLSICSAAKKQNENKKNRRLDKHAICTKKYMKIEFAKS